MRNYFTSLKIILLLLIAFSTNLVAEIEPNNNYQQANPIIPNGTDTGSLNEPSQSVNADNDDWWSITLHSDGSLYSSLTSTGTLDVDLYIIDVNGTTQLASGTKNGSFESVYHTRLKAGTYYIRAYRAFGTGSYSIQTVFNAAPYANDPEPNNTYQTASTLVLNSQSSGHIGYYSNNSTDWDDYWKVDIPYDGSLTVSVLSDSADIDLYILDINGTTQIKSATANGITETITFPNLKPGIYYVRCYGTSTHGGYTISTEYVQSSINGITTNDTEPNDNSSSAFDWLTFNSAGSGSGYGHLGFYSDNKTDWEDRMSITTNIDGKLVINVESNSTLDVDIYLLDVNGSTQIKSGTAYGTTDQLTFDNLAAGKYYVRLYRATGYGSYYVSALLTTPNSPNDIEINDSYGTSSQITLNNKTTGHLGYYSNNKTDWDDYYVLNLSSDYDSLYVRVDSEDPLDADLYLFNSQYVQLRSATINGNMDIIKYGKVNAGTYYIRVYKASGQGGYGLMCSNQNITNPLTDIKKDIQKIPIEFSLSQNYPNPFNPETTIKYDIPAYSKVLMKIYDVLGNEVATLVNKEHEAGSYTINFNAKNLSSGVYFYRISTSKFSQTKKFIVMK